jgi:hypothetical protein
MLIRIRSHLGTIRCEVTEHEDVLTLWSKVSLFECNNISAGDPVRLAERS